MQSSVASRQSRTKSSLEPNFDRRGASESTR